LRRRAFFFLLLATVIWGSSFPIQKLIIGDVSPTNYIAFRFAIAAIFSYVFWGKGNWKYGSLLGVILALGYLTQTVGLKYTTASKNGFFTSLYVVLVPVVSWILEKEKLHINQAVGLTMAGVGSYLLSGGVKGFNFGDFLSLLCAVAFAFHVVLITIFSKKAKEEDLLTPQFTITSVANAIFGLGTSWYLSVGAIMSALYNAALSTVFGIWVQVKYQKHVGSNTTAIIFVGEPIFAALFSWIILHETLSPMQFLGATLMVGAIIISGVKSL